MRTKGEVRKRSAAEARLPTGRSGRPPKHEATTGATTGDDIDRLGEADFRAALEFVRRCERAEELPAFRDAALTVLELVPGHIALYNEVDLVEDTVLSIARPQEQHFEGAGEAAAPYIHEHPVLNYLLETGDHSPRAISDLIDRDEFRSLDLYTNHLRGRGIEDELVLVLPSSPELGVALTVGRSEWGFSFRDRAVLRAVTPHVTNAYLAARARTMASERLGRGEDGPLRSDLLVLGPKRRVAVVGGSSGELIERYLGHRLRPGETLPEPLGSWLEASREEADEGLPPTPRELATSPDGRLLGRVLVGTAPGVSELLLLEEEPSRLRSARATQAGLSDREHEVAVLLIRGYANAKIAAELEVSEHTVKRHLERVYEKLGVRSRAQAIAALVR
jgi:DNA-binding CsgD family transcriptional regulator